MESVPFVDEVSVTPMTLPTRNSSDIRQSSGIRGQVLLELEIRT